MNDILADLRITQPQQQQALQQPSTQQVMKPHDSDFLTQIGKVLGLGGKDSGTAGAAGSGGGDLLKTLVSIFAG
jgi:hypothetical protein